MDLALLPDGDVLHTTRPGDVWYHDVDTGLNSLAASFDVYRHDEEGVQSIAVDPNAKHGDEAVWVYIYYSPPLDTPPGDAPNFGDPEDFEAFEGYIQLSRFQFSDGEIQMDTEEEIMQVPVDRGICCHVGGDIVFDSEGNLILSTGDDTNPFASNGYAPIDEREDRNPAYDAQRTSANTNDLRGKLLRITPTDGGGYTIPDGNLFEEGTADTRPEIYAMGFRNPFRIEVDPNTDAIYVGDYSPDARNPNPNRGPAGHGRWMYVDEPGNYGWPYCVQRDIPYVDYDFATGTSGDEFDCDGTLVNESPNNTGLTELPDMVDSEVFYTYSASALFPELETGGIGPMAGPAYDSDDVAPWVNRPPHRQPQWPSYYEDKPLFYEWTRDYIKAFEIDSQGDVLGIEPVLDSVATDNPMDLEFGPNGALYMLEYGDGFFSENPEAELSRIDYIARSGNHAPEVDVEADVTTGPEGLEVSFTSNVSDADGDKLRYMWDFDGDGEVDSSEENPTHVYDEAGVYLAHLTVADRGGKNRGKIGSDYVEIQVGNEAPVVEFITPQEGDAFSFGDDVAFEVQVTDDQPVDCSLVEVSYVLGHNTHGHPISTVNGCTGVLETDLIGGHDPDVDDLSGVFVAEYTDPGGEGGTDPLTGSDEVVLDPS
nr:PQQ-dependent sugar dehydrogenase [Salsipaludibacter albus]